MVKLIIRLLINGVALYVALVIMQTPWDSPPEHRTGYHFYGWQ